MAANIDYWEKILENPTPSFKELFDKEKKYLLDHIYVGARVLDVGCGNARNIQSIAEVTKNITGIDADAQSIQDARKNLSRFKEINVIQADIIDMPFADGSFDIVTCLDTIVNLAISKTKALSEMKRVLKDEGKIIISFYSETALPERLKIYKMIQIPIDRIEGTTVHFPKSIGAYQSEQFSLEQMKSMTQETGLKITGSEKIGDIAYICELKKMP